MTMFAQLTLALTRLVQGGATDLGPIGTGGSFSPMMFSRDFDI